MRTKTLLLSAAALLAAGIVSSQAQPVYSQNIVGYSQQVLFPGAYQMIANPLSIGGTNGGEQVLTGLQGGETIYVWNGNGYYAYNYLGAGNGIGAGGPSDWLDAGSPTNIPGDVNISGNIFAPNPTIPPGEGIFIINGNSTAETNVFTGTVLTTNSIVLKPGVYTLVSSAIPVSGDVETNAVINLGASLQGGENIYVWNGNGYYNYNYLGAGNGIGAGGPSDWLDAGSPTNIPGDVNISGNIFAPTPQIKIGQGFFILNGNSGAETWTQSLTNN